jgi:Fe-only nitrogenase accessory protein AnfO
MPEAKFVIAVFKDDLGDLAEIQDTRKILFFEKEGPIWSIKRILDFNFEGSQGLCHMRKRLFRLREELSGVKALAAKAFPGIAKDLLTRAGFILYELSGFEEEVLSGIEEDGEERLEEDSLGEEREITPKAPYEETLGSRAYFLDLRAALNAYPDLTTKKILRPFFDSEKFLELKVVYDHLPPWLPPELKTRKLSWDSFDSKGGVLIRIFPMEDNG